MCSLCGSLRRTVLEGEAVSSRRRRSASGGKDYTADEVSIEISFYVSLRGLGDRGPVVFMGPKCPVVIL